MSLTEKGSRECQKFGNQIVLVIILEEFSVLALVRKHLPVLILTSRFALEESRFEFRRILGSVAHNRAWWSAGNGLTLRLLARLPPGIVSAQCAMGWLSRWCRCASRRESEPEPAPEPEPEDDGTWVRGRPAPFPACKFSLLCLLQGAFTRPWCRASTMIPAALRWSGSRGARPRAKR